MRRSNIYVCCLLFLLGAGNSVAQVSIDPPIIAGASAYLSDWQSRSSTATVIVRNAGPNKPSVKIWTEFFLDGSRVAYSDASKLGAITLNVGPNVFDGQTLVPINSMNFENRIDADAQRSGRIPEGLLCLKVHVMDAVTGAELAVTPDATGCTQIVSYSPPELILPADGSLLCRSGANNVVFMRDGSPMPLFQWTPVVPAPTSVVTYRFAIFEVYPSQPAIAALRGNRPLVQSDLPMQTSFLWPIQYFFPEVGKQYAWSVRALDQNGNSLVQSNEGWAQPFVFRVVDDCSQVGSNSDSLGSDSTWAGSSKLSGETGANAGDSTGGNGSSSNGGSGNALGDQTANGGQSGYDAILPTSLSEVYALGENALVLDDQIAGFYVTFGHSGIGEVSDATNQNGMNGFSKMWISTGAGMSADFYDWINNTLEQNYSRKNGAIVAADYDHKRMLSHNFFQALITELSLPALDAASKEACRMSVVFQPESTHDDKPDTLKNLVGSQARHYPMLSASKFRVLFEGLGGASKRINKVESISIKQTMLADSSGSTSALREPGKIEFPNISIYLPETDASEIERWLGSNGSNAQKPRDGSIVYYSQSGRQECTLSIHSLHVVSTKPAPQPNGREDQVRLELSAERMSISK